MPGLLPSLEPHAPAFPLARRRGADRHNVPKVLVKQAWYYSPYEQHRCDSERPAGPYAEPVMAQRGSCQGEFYAAT